MEKLLDTQQRESGLFYLIQWKGYNASYNSWIPRAQFEELLNYLSPTEQQILMDDERDSLIIFPPPRNPH